MAYNPAQILDINPLERLMPQIHTDFGETGIGFYDDELDVAQGHPQGDMVGFVATDLRECLPEGWSMTTDNPIWVIDPDSLKQKTIFPDFTVLHLPVDERIRATMKDVSLIVEILTTFNRAKEEKDTKLNKALYYFNRAPEFLLLYPDLDDSRNVEWYDWTPKGYELKKPDADGFFPSQQVEGLSIKPLSENEWRPGRKTRFYYKDVPLIDRAKERAAKIFERNEKLRERKEKLREREEKFHERAEKERLLDLLRQAGIDPSSGT